jgi:site-specific DNA-cytosine methylase
MIQSMYAYRARKRAEGTGFGFSEKTENDVANTLQARYWKDGSDNIIFEEPKGCAIRTRTYKNQPPQLEIRDDNVSNSIDSVQKDYMVIEKKTEPMVADFRNDEGLRIRKNMLSPTLATRKHSETDISTMPPIIIAPNKKEIDLSNAPTDRPFQITEARTDLGKQSRREIREKEGRDSTLRSKDHKKYVPLSNDVANCITTGKENIEKWVFEMSKSHTIRRFTPVECERLQGLPDNGTKEGQDENGKIMPISDTQRYKVLGNAVTVNVVEAIGRTFCKTIDNLYVSQKEIRVRKTQPLDDWL